MTRARVWIAFALLSLAWGSSYLFIRIGDRQLSPVALVALRLLFAAMAIGVVAAVRRQDLRISRHTLLMIVVMSAFQTTIPFLLIAWGETTVTSGLASVLNGTVPIFAFLIAGAVLQDERLTVARVAGVLVGFAGVLLLFSRDITHSGIHWSGLAGQGAIVVASLCYAIGAILARRTLRGVPVMTITTYALAITATETVLLSLVFSPPPLTSMKPESLFAVLWLGILGTALSYIFYYFIIENLGASRATLVTYVLPIIGLALGAIFLGETLSWRIVAGSILVILGIVLAGLLRPRSTAGDETARHSGAESRTA